MFQHSLNSLVALSAILLCGQAQAAITLSSTRVIYDGDKKEASVTVRNVGSDEILIQSWLDGDRPGTPSGSIPFAVTPPLAHMGGQSRQVLRILFQGSGVPTDKESVFWLNVQQIPKAPEGTNVLQLAIRQRIKFFYRPAGLSGTPKDAPGALTWHAERDGKNSGLRVNNPSQYHVTITDLQVKGSDYTSAQITNFMIAPGASMFIKIPELPAAHSLTLSAHPINDFGAKELYSTPLGSATLKLEPAKK